MAVDSKPVDGQVGARAKACVEKRTSPETDPTRRVHDLRYELDELCSILDSIRQLVVDNDGRSRFGDSHRLAVYAEVGPGRPPGSAGCGAYLQSLDYPWWFGCDSADPRVDPDGDALRIGHEDASGLDSLGLRIYVSSRVSQGALVRALGKALVEIAGMLPRDYANQRSF